MAIASAGLFATQHIELKHSAPQPKKTPNEDDEIYTGSILFVPNNGKVCRQLLFDNRTGLINDNGLVDCEQAYYRSAADMQVSAAGRAQIVSESFRGRCAEASPAHFAFSALATTQRQLTWTHSPGSSTEG
jgi:hypothetical protein